MGAKFGGHNWDFAISHNILEILYFDGNLLK